MSSQRINSNVFYLKTLKNLDNKLIKYIHKDDYSLYVHEYVLDNDVYHIKMRDISSAKGGVYFDEYDVPKKNVVYIEELI